VDRLILQALYCISIDKLSVNRWTQQHFQLYIGDFVNRNSDKKIDYRKDKWQVENFGLFRKDVPLTSSVLWMKMKCFCSEKMGIFFIFISYFVWRFFHGDLLRIMSACELRRHQIHAARILKYKGSMLLFHLLQLGMTGPRVEPEYVAQQKETEFDSRYVYEKLIWPPLIPLDKT